LVYAAILVVDAPTAHPGAHDLTAQRPADERTRPVSVEQSFLGNDPSGVGIDEDEVGVGARGEPSLAGEP
jgi:hypothetical protein